MTIDHTRPTPHEVESLIGTLETSFTYDPPERWQHAYEQLRELRPRFRTAYAPYAWLELVGLAVFLVATVVTLFATFSSLIGRVDFISLGVLLIPLSFNGLASLLARRREPLLRYESKIEDACQKFDKFIAERDNAPA